MIVMNLMRELIINVLQKNGISSPSSNYNQSLTLGKYLMRGTINETIKYQVFNSSHQFIIFFPSIKK